MSDGDGGRRAFDEIVERLVELDEIDLVLKFRDFVRSIREALGVRSDEDDA